MKLLKTGKHVDITKYLNDPKDGLQGITSLFPRHTFNYMYINPKDDEYKRLLSDGSGIDDVVKEIHIINKRIENLNKDRDKLPDGSEEQIEIYEKKQAQLDEFEKIEQKLKDAQNEYLDISTIEIDPIKGESKKDKEARIAKAHQEAIMELRHERACEFIRLVMEAKSAENLISIATDEDYNVTPSDMKVIVQNAFYNKEHAKGKS